MNSFSPLIKKGAAFLFGLALAGFLPGMVAERPCAACAHAAAPQPSAAPLSISAAGRVQRSAL